METQSGYHEIKTEKTFIETFKSSLADVISDVSTESIFMTFKKVVDKMFAFLKTTIGKVMLGLVIACTLIVIAYSIFNSTLMTTFRSWVYAQFTKDTGIVVNEMTTQADKVEGVTEAFEFTSAIFGAPPKAVNKWVAEYAKMGTNLRSIEYLYDFVVGKMSRMVDFVCEKTQGKPFFETTTHLFTSKQRYIDAVEKLKKEKRMPLTAINSPLIIASFEELTEIALLCRSLALPAARPVFEMCDASVREFRDLYESAHKISFSPVPRVQPVWISITGPPGVGKSFVMERLKRFCCERVLQKEYDPRNVFPLNMKDQYFSGWHNQDITSLEECLTDTDPEVRNETCSLILKLVNTEPHPLVSAAIEDKGKHYFTSSFFITTANATPYPVDLKISDVTALWRRRSIVAELKRRDGDDYFFHFHDPIRPANGKDSFEKGNLADLLGRIEAAYEYNQLEFAKLKAAPLPEVIPKYKMVNGKFIKDYTATLGHRIVPQPETHGLDGGAGVYPPGPTRTDQVDQVQDIVTQGLWDWVPTVFVPRSVNKITVADFAAKMSKPPTRAEIKTFTNFFPNGTIDESNFHYFITMSDLWHYAAGFKCYTDVLKELKRHSPSLKKPTFQMFKRMLLGIRPIEGSFLTTVPIFYRYMLFPFRDNRHLTTLECAVFKTHVKHTDNGKVINHGAFMIKGTHKTFTMDPEVVDGIASGPMPVYEPFDNLMSGWMGLVLHGEEVALKDLVYSPTFWLTLVGTLGLLMGLCKLIWNMLGKLGFGVKENLETQSEDKHLEKVSRKVLRATRGKKRVIREYQNKKQMETQSSLSDGVLMKIATNVDAIEFITMSGKIMSCFATFVTGTIAAIPSHPFADPKDPVVKMILLWANSQPKPVTVDAKFMRDKIRFFKERDLAYIRVETGQLFKDIRSHMPKKAPVSGTMGTARLQFTEEGIPVVMHAGSGTEWSGTVKNPGTGPMSYKGTIIVPVAGHRGFCGLPYLYMNGAQALAGIHIAGNDMQSCIAPLFAEDLDAFDIELLTEAACDPVLPDPALLKEFKSNCVPLQFEYQQGLSPPGMRVVGKINVKLAAPSKTKLRESIVSLDPNCPFEKKEAPAKLRPFHDEEGVYIDPLTVSFKKFEKKALKEFPPFLREHDAYDGIFHKDFQWNRVRILTIKQAVNGIAEWGNFPGMAMNTSAGVGYTQANILRRDLFDGEEGDLRPKKVLLEQINRILECLKMGIMVPILSLGLLKDEKRPLDRVKKGNSRLFYAGDVANLVVHRMVLGGFISALECNPVASDVAIGINPFSSDWRLLSKRICKHGKDGITSSDIDGYDLNYMIGFMDALSDELKYRMPHIDREHHLALRGALKASVQPLVFIGSVVILMLIMCSGCLATAALNSAQNSAAHRGIFKQLAKRNDPDKEWKTSVEASFYGDDSVIGVEQTVRPWFNGKTIAAARLEMIGWRSTSPTKSLEINEFDKEIDALYLKRNLLGEGEIVMPSLAKGTIESMAMWYRKGDNPDEIQQVINIHAAIKESFFHGEEYFNKMVATLNPYLMRLSKQPWKETYNDLFAIHYSGF
jgi:hypothetical protein